MYHWPGIGIYTIEKPLLRMSDNGKKKTPMDPAAKSRIMSSEYKKNSGKSTDWSSRAQRAADKNFPQHQGK